LEHVHKLTDAGLKLQAALDFNRDKQDAFVAAERNWLAPSRDDGGSRMKTIASLLIVLGSGSVAYAGKAEIAAMTQAINDFCASQGQGGFWSKGASCRQKVLDGLQNGKCGMYINSQTLGTYLVQCK
jgi:hypothetical protein